MTTPGQQVQIRIDGKKYESPLVTTGAALYRLGAVKDGFDLFREEKGHGDDELIQNTQGTIEVHNGDQFYTAKHTLNPGC